MRHESLHPIEEKCTAVCQQLLPFSLAERKEEERKEVTFVLLFYKNIFQKLSIANTSVLFTSEILIRKVSMESKETSKPAEFYGKCNNSYGLLVIIILIQRYTWFSNIS